MKRASIIAVLLSIIIPGNIAYSKEPVNKIPSISSRYAVVIDYESGRVLYEKNSNKVVPMASTTKIVTAIVALENSMLNEVVTVSRRSASIHGSTIGLKQGQKLTMEELLYGLMLRSGNDCAIAIAEHIGGCVDKFVDMMNSKAFNIGAYNTHFHSPHGLDADGHFTSTLDLALITRYALDNTEFAKIISTKDITFDGISGKRAFHNINKLLYSLEGADGVKTGYTGKAGRCLVSTASRNNRRVICVVLNSPNRWEDSKKLINYGFNNYKEILSLNGRDYIRCLEVNGSSRLTVTAGFDGIYNIPVSQSEKEKLRLKIELAEGLSTPIYKGQQVGRLSIYIDDNELYSIPYKSLENIN